MSMSTTTLPKSGELSHQDTLINFYTDALAYTVESLKEEGTSAEGFRDKIKEFLEAAKERNAVYEGEIDEHRQLIYSENAISLAGFAVIAFVDELVVSSDWEGRKEWVKNPMQREIYRSMTAGSQFFENIEAIGDIFSTESRDLYEVYYYCLALGFQGVYYDNPDQLRQLMRAMHDRITRYDQAHQEFNMREAALTSISVNEFHFNRWVFSLLMLLALASVVGSVYFVLMLNLQDAVTRLLEIFSYSGE